VGRRDHAVPVKAEVKDAITKILAIVAARV
jgi:hypothetical protein